MSDTMNYFGKPKMPREKAEAMDMQEFNARREKNAAISQGLQRQKIQNAAILKERNDFYRKQAAMQERNRLYAPARQAEQRQRIASRVARATGKFFLNQLLPPVSKTKMSVPQNRRPQNRAEWIEYNNRLLAARIKQQQLIAQSKQLKRRF